ncbi:hypothetical protein [Bacillus pinisoli]|uniref:hypothetical protein n=1 Tax=Bacillus pinisoli TaxID=2901866 RepID=UPI001FF4D733|nr:hypothetical protein [Bacillus pinisoli]
MKKILYALMGLSIFFTAACGTGTHEKETDTSDTSSLGEESKKSNQTENENAVGKKELEREEKKTKQAVIEKVYSPRTGYTYVYEKYSSEGTWLNEKIVREVLFEEDGFTQILVTDPNGEKSTEFYYEDEDGFYQVMYTDGEHLENRIEAVKEKDRILLIRYPLEVGSKWDDSYGNSYEITSLDQEPDFFSYIEVDETLLNEKNDMFSKNVSISKVYKATGMFGPSKTYISGLGLILHPDYFSNESADYEGDFYSLSKVYAGASQELAIDEDLIELGKQRVRETIGDEPDWEEGYEIHYAYEEDGGLLYQVSKVVDTGRVSIYDTYIFYPETEEVVSLR